MWEQWESPFSLDKAVTSKTFVQQKSKQGGEWSVATRKLKMMEQNDV
jgi:hypothetical protein